jgi:hypothetical protein
MATASASLGKELVGFIFWLIAAGLRNLNTIKKVP